MPTVIEQETDRQVRVNFYVSGIDPESSRDFWSAEHFSIVCMDRTVTSVVGFLSDLQKFAIEVDVTGGCSYKVELFVDGRTQPSRGAQLLTKRLDPVNALLLEAFHFLCQGAARATFHLSEFALAALTDADGIGPQNTDQDLGSLTVKIYIPDSSPCQDSRKDSSRGIQTTSMPASNNVIPNPTANVVNGVAIPPPSHYLSNAQVPKPKQPAKQHRPHAPSDRDQAQQWKEWATFRFLYRHNELLRRTTLTTQQDAESLFFLPCLEPLPTMPIKPLAAIDPTPPHLRRHIKVHSRTQATPTMLPPMSPQPGIEAYLRQLAREQAEQTLVHPTISPVAIHPAVLRSIASCPQIPVQPWMHDFSTAGPPHPAAFAQPHYPLPLRPHSRTSRFRAQRGDELGIQADGRNVTAMLPPTVGQHGECAAFIDPQQIMLAGANEAWARTLQGLGGFPFSSFSAGSRQFPPAGDGGELPSADGHEKSPRSEDVDEDWEVDGESDDDELVDASSDEDDDEEEEEEEDDTVVLHNRMPQILDDVEQVGKQWSADDRMQVT